MAVKALHARKSLLTLTATTNTFGGNHQHALPYKRTQWFALCHSVDIVLKASCLVKRIKAQHAHAANLCIVLDTGVVKCRRCTHKTNFVDVARLDLVWEIEQQLLLAVRPIAWDSAAMQSHFVYCNTAFLWHHAKYNLLIFNLKSVLLLLTVTLETNKTILFV